MSDQLASQDNPPAQSVPPTIMGRPFGVRAVAEIPMNGVAPAAANAVYNAVGARIKELPLTPEKVWKAIKAR